MSALTSHQLDALRLAIRARLEQEHAQDTIREIANKSLEKGALFQDNEVKPQHLLEDIKQSGIIETILSQINDSRQSADSTQVIVKDNVSSIRQTSIDPQKRYVYIHVHGGKAFTDHSVEGGSFLDNCSTLTLYVDFRKQRFTSRSVPNSVEPAFDDSFLLQVARDSKQSSKIADVNSMLSMADHVHVVLVKHDAYGSRTVLTSQYLEWRHLLFSTNMKERTALPLYGIGSESKIVVGVLDITMEIIPKLSGCLQKDIVLTQFEIEQSRLNERTKSFFNYAKQWWKEYLQIRPDNNQRFVKIFAQDENGTTRPVCAFIRCLRAGRLLDSALHAARFVSVLGYQKASETGAGSSHDMWQSLLTTLSNNKGDVADHATLLCSLLLGFGLNAYVCFGTKTKQQPHAWVMTIGVDNMVTFYESLTGHKFVHDPMDVNELPVHKSQHSNSHPYITVGCVFNNREFYANVQSSDRVTQCTFDLLNESKWKSMDRQVLDSICSPEANPFWKNQPALSPPSIDVSQLADKLEHDIMNLIADYRNNLGLDTVFDTGLGYILHPALAAYEFERTLGVSVGSDEFQHAIRQYIPDGETFKGCPMQVESCNAKKAFATCLRSGSCEEIVACRGDNVRLAIRAKVVAFPENAISVWLMFACKYRSIL